MIDISGVGVFCAVCHRWSDGRSDVCGHCRESLISSRPLSTGAINSWVKGQADEYALLGVPLTVEARISLQRWASYGRPDQVVGRHDADPDVVAEDGPESSSEQVRQLMARDGISWREAWKKSGAQVAPPDPALKRQRAASSWRTAATVFGCISFVGLGFIMLLWLSARGADYSGEMAAGVIAGLIALPTLATWFATVVCLVGLASRTDSTRERTTAIGVALGMIAALGWLFTSV